MTIRAAGFRYIPKGAIKVSDKKSDAVAYLYMGGDAARNGLPPVPCARVFYGKQSKPVLAAQFGSTPNMSAEQMRQATVAKYFAQRQQVLAYKAERAAKRKAEARAAKIEVGSYFYTSWGYDQTNIDFYRVEKLIGATMALVVKVKPIDAGNGKEPWMTGKCIPSDEAVGEPFRVKLRADGFKVDRNGAWSWDGTPKNWTSYA